MQPDAAGLALATGVLAGVIGVFWFADRMISGPVADLSYTIGRQVARGVAEWAASQSGRARAGAEARREREDAGGPGRDEGGRDGGPDDGLPQDLTTPVLARVVGGRPRLRIDCRYAAAA
jgi:hypothetical protein